MKDSISNVFGAYRWERLDRQHPERGWQEVPASRVVQVVDQGGYVPGRFLEAVQQAHQDGLQLQFACYRIKNVAGVS